MFGRRGGCVRRWLLLLRMLLLVLLRVLMVLLVLLRVLLVLLRRRSLLLRMVRLRKLFLLRRSFGRMRALRGGTAVRVLRVGLLLREGLRALAEALVEGRAEGAREVGRMVEGRAVVGEVLVAVDMRRRRVVRLRFSLAEVRAVVDVLVDDGLVAALDEDGDVAHVAGLLLLRLRLRLGLLVGAHVGRRTRVWRRGHGTLGAVVRIDRRVGGALLA